MNAHSPFRRLLTLAGLMLVPLAAGAEEGATSGDQAAGGGEKYAERTTLGLPPGAPPNAFEDVSAPMNRFQVTAGPGQIGEDIYLRLNAGLDLDFGAFGFGLYAPLNILIDDRDPPTDHIGGVFRQQEWDEPAEFARFLRYVRVGRKDQVFYLRLGDLDVLTIGHGTIMGEYRNNVQLDHWEVGVNMDVNSVYAGAETMLGNVFDPYLLGGRLWIKPWSFVDQDSYINNWKVGVTAMSDLKSPTALRTTDFMGPAPENEPPPAPATAVTPGAALAKEAGQAFTLHPPYIMADEKNYPIVEGHKPTTELGVDSEFRVVNESWVTVTPYADLNQVVEAGTGFHLGVFNEFAPAKILRLNLRLEWRAFDGNYLPDYFDGAYELQRYQYPAARDIRRGRDLFTKRAYLEELPPDPNKIGWFGEGIVNVLGWIALGAAYEDYEGRDNSKLKLMLDIPALSIVTFRARYYKFDYDDSSEVFTFDERSLFLADLTIKLGLGFMVLGRFWRLWQLDPVKHSYEPADDWMVAVGYSVVF